MHFEVEQRFPAPPAAVAAVLVDPRFVVRLGELAHVEAPELLGQQRDGDVVHQRVRYRFAGRLPGAVTRVVEPARLVWVEETAHDLARARGTFRILPEHYAGRLECHGTHAAVDDGSGGTRRRVAGELRVRYPLVGGAVERAIVSGLRDHLGQQVELVRQFLPGPPAP